MTQDFGVAQIIPEAVMENALLEKFQIDSP